MPRQIPFISTAFGAAVLMFVAERIEYLGLDYMSLAVALTLGVVLSTIVLIALAARMFRRSGTAEVALASVCLAGLPFLVVCLLSLNGTELNVHGVAVLGYFIYFIGWGPRHVRSGS